MAEQNRKPKKYNIVFIISLALCIGIGGTAMLFRDSFSDFAQAAYDTLTTNFAWLYLLAMFAFVLFCLVIACSHYGSIRLGRDDERPEYSTLSWFGMLFGCGMGVGLIFWSVSEPISHYLSPTSDIEPQTTEAVAFSIKSSFMHWGLHPWANYAVIGLGVAYFCFRKGRKSTISAALEPLFGRKKIGKFLGKIVDILAVFSTTAGIVTSLGLGVMQINSGLNSLFGIPSGLWIQIIIVAVISVIYIWTSAAGIDRGIKKVSDLNLLLAGLLLLLGFAVGPKTDIMNALTGGLGDYLGDFIKDSLNIHVFENNRWILTWRVFYWAWWIAWAPYVGVFIARISRGRTIREFITGVVLIPAVASILWFSVFGTLGLSLCRRGLLSADQYRIILESPEQGLFIVLRKYPLGMVLSILALILLFTFFITSANSGTYVLAMMTSGGNLNPPAGKKVIWGIVQSGMAVALLAAGGLVALQTLSITAALLFLFVMICMMISLVWALRKDEYVPSDRDAPDSQAGK